MVLMFAPMYIVLRCANRRRHWSAVDVCVWPSQERMFSAAPIGSLVEAGFVRASGTNLGFVGRRVERRPGSQAKVVVVDHLPD
jgi:hypothetical protein